MVQPATLHKHHTHDMASRVQVAPTSRHINSALDGWRRHMLGFCRWSGKTREA